MSRLLEASGEDSARTAGQQYLSRALRVGGLDRDVREKIQAATHVGGDKNGLAKLRKEAVCHELSYTVLSLSPPPISLCSSNLLGEDSARTVGQQYLSRALRVGGLDRDVREKIQAAAHVGGDKNALAKLRKMAARQIFPTPFSLYLYPHLSFPISF